MKTIAKPQTTGTWVYQVLRAEILDGALPPGSLIRQEEIARRLNVSRMPVRETIRKLSAEGWIEDRPNRMSIVADLNPDDARELFLIRAQLEKLAVRISFPELGEGDLQAVSRAHTALGNCSQDDFSELHRAFHMALYVHAGDRLKALIVHHLDLAERYLRFEHAALRVSDEDREEHLALHDAAQSRDADRAETILQPHIAEAGEDIARALRVHLETRT